MANPQVSFINTTIESTTLAGRRREAAFTHTLPVQLNVLKETGRYDAFKLKWHSCYNDPPDVWPVPNHLFWDSDVAKWIEGACYFIQQRENPEIDAAIEELVEMIRSAQQPDGYLNIHFTVVEPEKRFTNFRDLHELYNCGHLIEAALAHNHLYNNDRLLEPVLKYVDLLCKEFGPGQNQRHGYPGHPEIELALLRLHQRTGDKRHLDLAKYFLQERGNRTGDNGRHFYEVEADRRGDDPNMRPAYHPSRNALWYYQAHQPIVEQKTVEGHSVRAMYLLTAVADLLCKDNEMQDSDYATAVKRLWDNMVNKKMYLTGGIGAIKQYEGFGIDYFLPQGTDEGGCYSETCAAIGVMMLAERLLQLELKREYADIMELCFYNSVLTGMSCDGKRFTYVNQLASSASDPSQREEWFTCACCPPNMLRILGYLGGYLWTHNVKPEDKSASINVHMYMSSELVFGVGSEKVSLRQSSNWPWEGDVDFELQSQNVQTTVRLRIPGWAPESKLTPSADYTMDEGYITLTPEWLSKNPNFRLSVPITPRTISPHPYTNQDVIAIARGPVVYCVEDVDHPWVSDHFKSTIFNPQSKISETVCKDPNNGEQYVALTAHNAATSLDLDTLNTSSNSPAFTSQMLVNPKSDVVDLHLVPYYFRANRTGKGQMRVGLRRWR